MICRCFHRLGENIIWSKLVLWRRRYKTFSDIHQSTLFNAAWSTFLFEDRYQIMSPPPSNHNAPFLLASQLVMSPRTKPFIVCVTYFWAMGVRICFISSMMFFSLSGFPSKTFSMVLHTDDWRDKHWVSTSRRREPRPGVCVCTLQMVKVLPYSSSVSRSLWPSTALSL